MASVAGYSLLPWRNLRFCLCICSKAGYEAAFCLTFCKGIQLEVSCGMCRAHVEQPQCRSYASTRRQQKPAGLRGGQNLNIVIFFL